MLRYRVSCVNPRVERSKRAGVLVAGLAVVLLPRLARREADRVEPVVEEPLGEAFAAGLVLGTERALLELVRLFGMKQDLLPGRAPAISR